MIAIVDAGLGNLRSVEKALHHVGADARITALPDEVRRADRVVVPGQGSFGDCMSGLRARGLDAAVTEAVARGVPYLGICLGLQVLFDTSDEAPGVPGLAIFRGANVRFEPAPGIKIPHMGWSRVHAGATSRLLAPADGAYFYFVHSFFPRPADDTLVAATATHGAAFCAAIERENVLACQFHPEKSGREGLALLERFARAR